MLKLTKKWNNDMHAIYKSSFLKYNTNVYVILININLNNSHVFFYFMGVNTTRKGCNNTWDLLVHNAYFSGKPLTHNP